MTPRCGPLKDVFDARSFYLHITPRLAVNVPPLATRLSLVAGLSLYHRFAVYRVIVTRGYDCI